MEVESAAGMVTSFVRSAHLEAGFASGGTSYILILRIWSLLVLCIIVFVHMITSPSVAECTPYGSNTSTSIVSDTLTALFLYHHHMASAR